MTTTTIDINEMTELEIKAVTAQMQPLTPKIGDYVESALLHVRGSFPTCTRVLFDDAGRWRYMDTNNEAFDFTGARLNQDLLEIASDTLDELPVLFEL